MRHDRVTEERAMHSALSHTLFNTPPLYLSKNREIKFNSDDSSMSRKSHTGKYHVDPDSNMPR